MGGDDRCPSSVLKPVLPATPALEGQEPIVCTPHAQWQAMENAMREAAEKAGGECRWRREVAAEAPVGGVVPQGSRRRTPRNKPENPPCQSKDVPNHGYGAAQAVRASGGALRPTPSGVGNGRWPMHGRQN